MLLQQRDLPLKMNISLNGCKWIKSVAEQLLKMLFDRRWRLDRLKTLINNINESVEFYHYPTVITALIHLIKPGLIT